MNKKILESLLLCIMCTSTTSYAMQYSLPVWSETGIVREVSNEALRRKFFKY